MSELFLFCGGPKIYGQGLSKPLRVMPSGNTLLKTYLSHVRESFDKPIWLLIEESDSEIIEASLGASNFGEVGIFSCPNGSSTLQKLDFLLKTLLTHIAVCSSPTLTSFLAQASQTSDTESVMSFSWLECTSTGFGSLG